MDAAPPQHHPLKSPNPDEPDPARSAPLTSRKKGTGLRAWLSLNSAGRSQVVEAGKHAIMRRTGVPARDLRILDPLLSCPSTILGREKAIVINLEHVKAIVTAHEVLLLNSRDPSVTPFVDELQRRLARQFNDVARAQEGIGDESNWTNLYDMGDQSRPVSPECLERGFLQVDGVEEENKADGKPVSDNQDRMKFPPFEFIALEACLESACTCLENEARTLEQEAHPALDQLTSKISTLNLERVRQIKSRLVAITGQVRDELEHLLDDDEDMAEMYLTEKWIQQQLENSSASTISEREDAADEVSPSGLDDSALDAQGSSSTDEGDLLNNSNPRDLFEAPSVLRESHGTHTSTAHSAMSKQLDVEELEMLLEAYFVQIDGTLNKLSTLREYVDDTEDYINIMLDDKQNHLLQMGVMLTTATLVVSAFVVITGVFGMNIKIDLFDDTKNGTPEFLWNVGGSTTGSLFLYMIAMAWCRHKRLLE
ncbi:hypothetical protein MLD38_023285 [Melastoma candidum]|uniref:Uncharacterized protein n=1 Tax=Melastoma candidum TaxID=119954 RepID=A0ACB9QM66_9MYRT|nr:hypothetical protein MLD38_023285 [Melastoma candidum]